MYNNLINTNIQQYFADTTYHAIPPTVRKFKLFIISGFNLKDKNSHICCYALIQNEKFETYFKIFSVLKNTYNFNPKMITIDFSKALTKAINMNFPEGIIIKCYFHWSQALWKNMKKYSLIEKEMLKRNEELMLNIKLMAFMKPNLLGKFYDLIIEEYEEEYEKFFKYIN